MSGLVRRRLLAAACGAGAVLALIAGLRFASTGLAGPGPLALGTAGVLVAAAVSLARPPR
ncbi:MAG: hypothetical protein ACR2JO_02585 [Mycobacteriales bacterium]